MTRATLLAGLTALVGAPAATPAAPPPPPSYTVTDLGALGGPRSLADGVNDSGQAVGSADLPGGKLTHGFLFTYDPTDPPATLPAVPLTDLGTFGGVTGDSNARAVNSAGQVVGYAATAAGGSHAFLYTPGLPLTDLGTLGGVTSVGFGVEGATPLIVGGADTGASDGLGEPIAHAFAASGGMAALQDLGVLAGFGDSAAYGVSPGGAIVGSSYDGSGTLSQATLFTPGGTPHGLGTLPGGSYSDAYAASNALAVGDSDIASGTLFPVSFGLTKTAASPTSLGLLPGYADGVAYGLNAAGAIVGVGYNPPAAPTGAAEHAFLYTGGTPHDLNGLITTPGTDTVLEAFAINTYGQIVGDGLNAKGALHAFLLSPTPTVTGLSRNAVAPGATGVTLTVDGANFAPDAVVYYNGIPESTTYVSPTHVTATIASTGAAGSATVDVGTPTPGGNSQTLGVGATTTISGTITLQGWLGTGEPTPTLAFVLTPSGGGATVTQSFVPTPTTPPPCSTFSYALTGVAPGLYTLGIKGPIWLRQDVNGVNGVSTIGGNVTGANVRLPVGDATGNNIIDSADLGVLHKSYNTVKGPPARPGFNPAADFNGDGRIDSSDLGLLHNTYNTVGAPF